MEQNTFFEKRMKELANTAYQRDIVTFSDFLNLNEQNIMKSRIFSIPGIRMEWYGGYENAERQMVAFHPDALVFPWEYPIDCLKIEPKSVKFSDKLTHRDYLGALLNLGIERNVLGDILIQEHAAWVFCLHRITPFLLENLCRIKHTVVTVTQTDNPEEIPGPNLQPVTGTCASVRLDSLISLAFQESRSSMVSSIEGRLVFVNGRLITSNGYEPKEGDIISVRGKGRFRFDEVTGKTKKGRCAVRIMRYN